MTYAAKVLENVTGGWGSQRIGIFQDENQIGEYLRNYHGFGTSTFFPFEKDGKWYALYAEHYTCTYLMSLPDCKKIGGEEPVGHGFCPVEYFVPKYKKLTIKGMTEEEMEKDKIPKQNWHWVGKDQEHRDYDCDIDVSKMNGDRWLDGPLLYDLNMGLVAGCYWGADYAWEVQHLDLTQVDKNIIQRNDLGGILLPNSLSLKDAVRFSESGGHLNVAIQKDFQLKDGKLISSD
jgi:hypothetical protein